jgi:nitrile hydratase accessory protein
MSPRARRRPDRPPHQAGQRDVERLVKQLPSADAIPRREGELAFDSPWEIRAFALAVAAHKEGRFPWPDFQARLISAIKEWEATPLEARGEWSYYRQWLRALEGLAEDSGVMSAEEIEVRAREYLGGTRDPRHR